MVSYGRELEKAIEIAYKAGREIMKYYGTTFEIDYKKDGSLLTAADIASNDIIINGLKDLFPDYAVLSEETKDNVKRRESTYCWIIDPLDGTKEFANQFGEFTVNIALVRNGEPVVGVIYVPVVNSLYYASKHCGAWKIFKGEINQINVCQNTKNLRLAVSRSHKSSKMDELLKQSKGKVAQVIAKGSSLKGCYVAEGRADVYYRFGLTSEWDTAAMHIIVEEAGGIFRDLNNEKMTYNRINTLNENGFYILNREENKLK